MSRNKQIKKYLISFGVSLAVCVAAVLVASAIAFATKDPASLCEKFALVTLALSSVICGWISSKVTGDAMLSGAIVGAALSLFLALVSIIFFKSSLGVGKSFVYHLVVVALSVLGSFLGRKKNNVRRYKRRRR